MHLAHSLLKLPSQARIALTFSVILGKCVCFIYLQRERQREDRVRIRNSIFEISDCIALVSCNDLRDYDLLEQSRDVYSSFIIGAKTAFILVSKYKAGTDESS